MGHVYSYFLILSLTVAVTAALDNQFIIPHTGYTFTVGESTSISWQPTTKGTVGLNLESRADDGAIAFKRLVQDLTNSGFWTWDVPSDLDPEGWEYTIAIISDDDSTTFDRLPYFRIQTQASTPSPVTVTVIPTTTATVPTPTPTTASTSTTTNDPSSSTPTTTTDTTAEDPSSTPISTSTSSTSSGTSSTFATAPQTSSSPTATNPPTTGDGGGGGDGLTPGAKGGIGAGVGVGVLVVVFIGFCFWRRRRHPLHGAGITSVQDDNKYKWLPWTRAEYRSELEAGEARSEVSGLGRTGERHELPASDSVAAELSAGRGRAELSHVNAPAEMDCDMREK